MKKQIERLRDDARRAREKAAHSYESTEIQLNDSLNENRELQGLVHNILKNNSLPPSQNSLKKVLAFFCRQDLDDKRKTEECV